MSARPLLLLSSTLFTTLGTVRILFPASNQMPQPASADAAAPLQLLLEIGGLLSIVIAAMTCTVSRKATTAAVHGVAISHLADFLVSLYLWDANKAAGYPLWLITSAAVLNVLIALGLLGAAAAAGHPPAIKAPQYGFTMLLSTISFLLFLAFFFAPAQVAAIALGYTGGDDQLITVIQMESVLHFTMSALLCTNARSCSRPFCLGVATATGMATLWAIFQTAAGHPNPIVPWFGAVNAFITFYYLLTVPSVVKTAKAAKAE